MRVRRLELRNVGGVTAAELVVPEHGVSVVLAPNETGKSTFLRAYRLLLSKTGHSGRTKDVQALRPVGRDIGSTVAAELVIGGETFAVERTYNKRPESSLTVKGRATITRTGKQADELLRSRFLDAVDVDLYELLMFEQGRTLESLAGAASATVIGALRESGSEATGESTGDALLAALERRVREAFHSRNDSLIGALKKQQLRVEDAESERDKHAARVEALSGDGGPTDGAGVIDRLTGDLKRLESRIERAAAADRAVTARKLVESLTEQVQQRSVQLGNLAKITAEEAESSARVAATRKSLTDLEGTVAALEKESATAAAERQALLGVAAQAESNLLAALEGQAEAARAALAEEQVDELLVTRARALERDVELAEATLRGGAWELSANALRALSLEVDGERIELSAGETDSRSVSASFVLKERDETIIDLHADSTRREAFAAAATASADLAALLAGVGASDLAALEARLAARDEILQRIDRDLRYVDELRAEAVAESLPPPQKEGSKDIDQLESAHVAALEELGRASVDAGGPLLDAKVRREQLAFVLAQQMEEHERASTRREDAETVLEAARAERSDDALGHELDQARASLLALGDVGDQEDVRSLQEQRAKLEAARDEAKRRSDLEEGRRSSIEAMRVMLETLVQNADDLRTEFDRDVREARAARTLLARLESARAEQGDRYREPLEARIREQLTRLYGFDCRVELDDDLRIVQRSDAEGRMIPWDQLSGGAKEQAAVVAGLAIAELAGEGGVPFWIDDAIVFTDDDRVEGLKELLAESSAQVIVMTCRAELAEGLPAARLTVGGAS